MDIFCKLSHKTLEPQKSSHDNETTTCCDMNEHMHEAIRCVINNFLICIPII